MAFEQTNAAQGDPLLLIVPGLGNSGQGHWQTRWEETLPLCRRVDLGLWDDPHRNTWVNKINLAVDRADRPVVLVAHSLGCHAVAWWAEYERLSGGDALGKVIGALLVAPPDVEDAPIDRRLTRFAPVVQGELPFRSVLVASRDDPYMPFGTARTLAKTWGASFADAGATGHINARSGLGDWTFGRLLLNRLLPRPLSLDDGAAHYGAGQRRFIDPALRRLGA
ncbi:RBBP9/YdeN family alpha/beta hydrolase [Novosphingobium sp.]|uniref:RBBP9/YdeN family alpha/beta hydrolase n=1 Tax=Novosphingobium sp. TaxID=1874826 RepID=UPI0038BBB3A1|nr:alpha/beta hydrolase [Pseudomonadota bacterium]